MLRPLVEGRPPGHVFRVRSGEQLELEIGLQLASREPMDYLEIIRNGQVEFEIRLQEFAKQGGKLPKLNFSESGWFLLRVVTSNSKFYQRAMTAPYYVEVDGKPRISRKAIGYFLSRVQTASDANFDPIDSNWIEFANSSWNKKLSEATVD